MIIGLNFTGPAGRPSEAGLISLCSSIYTNLWPAVQGMMATSYQLTMIEATDRYAVGGAYGSFTPAVPVYGTKAGDPLPANVASVVTWLTGLAGRRARGRTFMFGWTDSDFIGSTLISAGLVALSNWASTCISYAGAVGVAVDFSVLSLKDMVLRPVNGYRIDVVADSQRRRLPGRGF